jgi:group II intron reverse transcriptase/maturase
MREADAILGVIRERGRRGLPLERVYRLLFQPALYLLAYGRIAGNGGALTPGSTAETADGMSLAKIEAIIDAVRHERYRWTPVRRTYIEKKGSTKRRPLGIPTWSDKLLQEVLRLILEAYYEPQFSPRSHGYRRGRGCHTALTEIYHTWLGTTWFIEADISQCFDKLDHQVLLATLGEKVHDGRFLRLIENLLKAGYLEAWTFNATLSGTPQGGVLSPLLANIYLDRLDTFVETRLLSTYTCGTRRRKNPTYDRLSSLARRRAREGRLEEARALRGVMQRVPSGDPNDPTYRRLRYIRYADDFLLGFAGPRAEAEAIQRQLGEFLHDTLKLELSETKTRITHARTEAARFLGYGISVIHADAKRHTRLGSRVINGKVGLLVPVDVVRSKCAPYLQRGKPIHLAARMDDAPFSIVAQYHQEFRGLVDYYRMAYNLHRLGRLQWVMEQSLTKTLAAKFRTSVSAIYDRYRATLQTPDGPRKVLRVQVDREGKPPLVVQWGDATLKRDVNVVLDDQPRRVWNRRTELLERLLASTCELCGSQEHIQVHHVRALKDLTRKGRGDKPAWVQTMAARHRKTLVTCESCHDEIHAGRAMVTQQRG